MSDKSWMHLARGGMQLNQSPTEDNQQTSGNNYTALPGVPLVESPFFSDLFPAQRDDLTARIARALHVHGAVRIRFRGEDFDSVADAVIRDLKDQFDWERWRSGEGDLRIQDAWRTSDAVRKIATSGPVLRLLEQLYGRRAFPFQTLNFPVGTQQHFHSDSLHFSSVPERFMCAVWVALEDVTLDNGPLIYYPGSHRWPIYTNEHLNHCQATSEEQPTQERFHNLWRELVRVNGVEPQRFTARKGDALIWAANLLHGGDIQHDRSLTRWSQVTHYYFEGCAYYTPLSSDPMIGMVDFRSPVDISTGETVPSTYCGATLSDAYLQTCRENVAQGVRPFDPVQYLLANPDVAEAKMDALEHYLRHGKHEGRRLRP